MEVKLDFVIAGGQKCGSTFLQKMLISHPEIDMVEGERPDFESPIY